MYEENPNVESGFDRRITFPKMNWIDLNHFSHLLSHTQLNIYPCMSERTDYYSRNKLTFIGKSLPQQTINTNPNIELSELIGCVYFDDQVWKLRVSFNGQEYTIDENFLVLHISDPDSFEWKTNKAENVHVSQIPKYAFRATLHKFDTKYSYIGRTLSDESDCKRPKFYANSWLLFDDLKAPNYGRVVESYNMLFTVWHGIEIGHDRFDVLCLKPSPASLKTLCQLKIREQIGFSQAKIKAINKSDAKLLPDVLINYLEYPCLLKTGQSLLKNEKLVASNGLYELCINNAEDLVCRCLTSGTETVIEKGLTTIHFHKFKSVFYNQNDSTAKVFHTAGRPDYMFGVEWAQASYFFQEFL